MTQRILVTGGSISAATLAYRLLEGGFEVTLVEAAPSFRPGGQSIDVRGAGRTVLERMGVAETVDAHGTGESAWTFVTETRRTAAGELATAPDHARAFAQYERRLRPFVEEGQGVPEKAQIWTHPLTRTGIATQQTVLGFPSLPLIRDAFMKLGMRKSEEIDLPDYAFGTSARAR